MEPSKASLEKEIEREPARQAAIQQAQETTNAIAAGLSQEKDGTDISVPPEETSENQQIHFPTGHVTLQQLIKIFENLPVDLTFVDDKDIVRFYSESDKRVFPRTNSVIGREVVNCHPPKSMHMVQQILDDFRAGTRDTANFWIDLGPKKIYIRYFALRDGENYLGCLEVTQDITEIQKIDGQHRLLD